MLFFGVKLNEVIFILVFFGCVFVGVLMYGKEIYCYVIKYFIDLCWNVYGDDNMVIN